MFKNKGMGLEEGAPSANQKATKGRPNLVNPYEKPEYRDRTFDPYGLRGFLRGIIEVEDEEQKLAWISLCALGASAYPIAEIKYTTEKEIADLLGIKEDVLVKTIERAQAQKRLLIHDEAIIPLDTKEKMMAFDPIIKDAKPLDVSLVEDGSWAKYRRMIFLDDIFPCNKNLKVESFPEEVPISKRNRKLRSYRFKHGPKIADLNLAKDRDRAVALWNTDWKKLRAYLDYMRYILWTVYHSLILGYTDKELRQSRH